MTNSAPRFPLGSKPLPPAPRLRSLLGPSFIILGLGLGSGEVILWPFLSSNYGLGIIWGALVGITFQFFINMEVERYALAYGESIFVGFARFVSWLPAWFILSTFLGFGWPGIGLAGAQLLSELFGIENSRLVGVGIFILIGCILTFGKVLYNTVEMLQKWIIGFGVPFIIIVTLYLAKPQDYSDLANGLLGVGDGYRFFPEGLSLMVFLGALAYSGAGGNLNLAQSFYVRDKGYGMGIYAGKIKSLLTGKGANETISLAGNTFPLTDDNLHNFRQWWKRINIEHLLVFWLLGLGTMILLALLAYTTVYGLSDNGEGIQFVINESHVIGTKVLPIAGQLFLLITGIILSATQLTVLDSTSRIITENVLLWKESAAAHLSRLYYIVLWSQIAFGITVFLIGFDQPRVLITLGGVINAFAMFGYIALLLWLNTQKIPAPLRPGKVRRAMLVLAWLFFGVLSMLTIWYVIT